MEEGFILKYFNRCTLTDVAHPVMKGVVAGAKAHVASTTRKRAERPCPKLPLTRLQPPKGSTAFQTASPFGNQVCKYTNL